MRSAPSLTVTDESITLTQDGSSTTIRWDELSRFAIKIPEYDWIITSREGRVIVIGGDIESDETDEFTERMGVWCQNLSAPNLDENRYLLQGY